MYNILVVEDDKVNNDLLTYHLKENEYEVIQAFDGKEAIEMLQRFHFHLVLTDIMMPNKDGYELLQYMQDNRYDIPIVLITSLNSDYDYLKGYTFKIEDYITKPFNADIVTIKVQIILDRIYGLLESTKLSYGDRKFIINGEEFEFSNKEFLVFEFLYTNKLKYMSKEAIFEYAWEDDEEETNLRVVDYTVKRIRKKLGEKYRDLIKTKVGLGYKYEEW